MDRLQVVHAGSEDGPGHDDQDDTDNGAGEESAVIAGKRRSVHLKGHADGGFVDGERSQPGYLFRVAQRVGNSQLIDAGDRDDVTRFR